MEKVLPWKKLLRLLQKAYPQGERGRPPIELEQMLRIYFLQQWYQYSDEGMEDALYDTETLRRFVSVKIEGIPNETTICKFRHYLEKHELTEKLFALSGQHLANQGLLLSPGTIVDASIIAAPSSTENLKQE